MRVIDINFSDILLEKKIESISVHDILFKTLMGEKPLCIKFNKVDGLIESYDGIRYLVLFSYL